LFFYNKVIRTNCNGWMVVEAFGENLGFWAILKVLAIHRALFDFLSLIVSSRYESLVFHLFHGR